MKRPRNILLLISLVMLLAVPATVLSKGGGVEGVQIGPPPGEPDPPPPGPGVFVTTTDNENNAHTGSPDSDMGTAAWYCIFNVDPIHPVEFNIQNNVSPVASALLSVLNYDVDIDYEGDPELDGVYFNGNYVGDLSGGDEQWKVDTFTLNPSWVQTGNNLVEIQMDTTHPEEYHWCGYVRWGALEVAAPPPPFVPEASTIVLLGSGLAGLAGYAGLRLRGWRRKE